MLANKAVTAVRQRVTRDLLGRRGREADPAGPTGGCCCAGVSGSPRRRWRGCGTAAPTTIRRGQILAAWIAKEELRALCATAARGGNREDIHRRLWAFYRWYADADIPELTTLAETIETWWPAVEVFSHDRAHERPDQGHQQVDQAGETRRLWVRNRENYRRRARLHSTRHTRRLSARKPTVPFKIEEPHNDRADRDCTVHQRPIVRPREVALPFGFGISP
jgi:hypothetical protein